MPASGNLKRVLTRLKLRQLAGAKAFEHGAEYFTDGRVLTLAEQSGKLTATVQGADTYHVSLSAQGGGLEFECSCPMGAEGAFCRHCVAVGLAWLADETESSRLKKSPELTPPATMETIRAWLVKCTRDELVEIILERAAKDPRLRERLFETANSTDKNPK